MIYERLELGFDIEKLRRHLQEVVFPLKPMMQGAYFGGWSVLSSNGSYTDGWQMGHLAFQDKNGQSSVDRDALRAMNLDEEEHFNRPTEIYSGYLQQVMEEIQAYGLTVFRARISLLTAGGRSSTHRDGADESYKVRLHIPIITNPGCFFETEEGAAHFPADGGAYVVRVNRLHTIYNRGTSHRFHLMMNIRDTNQSTKYHQMPLTAAMPATL